MTDNSTPPAAPATLTEQQLFKEFAGGDLIYHNLAGEPEVQAPVHLYFTGGGEIDDFSEVIPCVLENLRNDPDPTYGLSVVMDTLRGIYSDLKIVHDAFQRVKAQRLVETGRNELEHNKRYRAGLSGDGMAGEVA